MISKLLTIGSKNQPEYLQKKLFTANISGYLLIFGVAIPYTVLTYFLFPPLTLIPAVGIVVVTISLLFIGIRWHLLGRSLMSLMPTGLAVSYGALLMPADKEPAYSMLLIAFSFIVIPILLFDFRRERAVMIISSALTIGIFLSFEYLNAKFELDINDEAVRTGWFAHVSRIIAIVLSFGFIITLAYTNLVSEKRIEEILIEAKSKNDQLETSEKELNQKLAELAEKQKEEEIHNWISESNHTISMLFRNTNQEIKVLAKTVITELVKCIEAEVGAIFIINESGKEPVMEALAAFGYRRNKYINKSFEQGDGIIGEIWMEKKPRYITNVPEDYMNITTGLGDANPTCIYLVPLVFNEKVVGVFELASFTLLEEHKQLLVRQIAESMAITVVNILDNNRTVKLLEQSNELSSQLQAQEEELRQNTEEMLATQEEMDREINRLQEELEKCKSGLEVGSGV